MIRNERGIALVITLLIVALLTITVVEFTYSVEVDQHMARNALNSLQATLLARSGINMGEAFLLHDEDNTVDAFTEEWCPQAGPGGHSCLLDETNSQVVVPENMRLRVAIMDESGKVNLNLTKPANVGAWRRWRTWRQQGADPKLAPGDTQAWLTVVGRLLAARGVDDQVAEAIADYWDKEFERRNPDPQGSAPSTPNPTPNLTQNPQQNPNATVHIPPDFPSLDDAALVPSGLTPSDIRRLRSVLTALDTAALGVARQVNVNTASREVLGVIVGDPGVADNIISQREGGPIEQKDLAGLLQGIDRTDPVGKFAAQMLGARSTLFVVRASAIVNPNPLTGRGGISRSASMLVSRRWWGGPAHAQPPAGTPRWTLTRWDWQKEGGAALFRTADQDSGVEDPSLVMPPEG